MAILWGCEEPRCTIHAPNQSVDLGELERCVLAEALFTAGMADGLRAGAGEDQAGASQGGERRG